MKKRLNKLVGVLLALTMMISMVPSAFAAGSDISGHWAEAAMQSFIDDGYVKGDGRGHYTPNATMSRAQFAAILNRMVGLSVESSSMKNYTDVSEKDWYYQDLSRALAAGFLNGTSATTLSPKATVTRQQAFTMLARYLKLDTTDTSALSAFSDAEQVADYAKGAVAAMVTAGYVQGADGKLLPEKQLTRAEGITVLYRAKTALQAIPVASAAGSYKDGVYTGTGAGYGGTIKVQMTVSGGRITEIKVLNHNESGGYFSRAQKLLDTILEKQTTDGVDVVSGATKSSNGLLTAVSACISQAKGGSNTSITGSTGGGGDDDRGSSDVPKGEDIGTLTPGTYVGSARGYSGTTTVQVTVGANGKITEIKILSHSDSKSYFESATAVLDRVVEKQSTKVDVVSGATYSSRGILSAIENALKDATGADDKNQTYSVASWKELLNALASAKDGDTVKLAADITDAGQVDAVSSATAAVNKSITVDGNGKTVSAAGSAYNFCFALESDAAFTAVIKDLTIDGASYSAKLGGAMFVNGKADVTLSGVTFKNCQAGNTSSGNGGGAVLAQGSNVVLTAENCTFSNNQVNNGTTGRGGAVMAVNADVTLQGCSFDSNRAAYGGAVAALGEGTSLTVKDCTFAASNDGVYGGDDIYIFDGYTYLKKAKCADSSVTAVLTGNTLRGQDGKDFTSYRVVCGRVLGDVTDTTNGGEYGDIVKNGCAGSGKLFLAGHDLTFKTTDYDRKSAPTEAENNYQYVLMNIPYEKFYAAELTGNSVPVDGVSSATLNKTRSGGMMSGGSYHVNSDGSDITGVIFPVVVSGDVDLSQYRQITDDSSVTVTVTNRGQTSSKEYKGADALFESDSYSYYVLSEAPAYYKVLSKAENGDLTFGSIQNMPAKSVSANASLQTETTYGDYQLNLTGTGMEDLEPTIYGVVVHTDGSDYGLRHLENIWRYTQLAWCAGITTSVHNCSTSSAHYESMMGKTITGVTYFTNEGQFDVAFDAIKVPVKVQVQVTDANVSGGETTVNVNGLQNTSSYQVLNAAGEAVEGFTYADGKLSWDVSQMLPGAYTLKFASFEVDDITYLPVTKAFTLTSETNPISYDAAQLGLTGEGLANYLSNITQVSVDGASYAPTGRGAVVVVDSKTGRLELSAACFAKDPADAENGYQIVITAAGYPELSFSAKLPDTVYAYASVSYAEYWENEDIDVVGGDLTAAGSELDGNNEHDTGAFDAVTRATVNHGRHRGSFQQDVIVYTTDPKVTFEPVYWTGKDTAVLADGSTITWSGSTITANGIEYTYDHYEIVGIKYVPVAVARKDFSDFCKAYKVTCNGETLRGGYTEGNLNSYDGLIANVTENTNGLKTVSRENGVWSFSARQTGTESGILNQELAQVSGVTIEIPYASQFGDFLRVDLKGDYGPLGSKMQTVLWTYYGDSDSNTPLATYGTKFASDDWMHKSLGIQLGLTDSLRCRLPEGTDGTGKWELTVYALGYADYTVKNIIVTADDLHGANTPARESQMTELEETWKLLVEYWLEHAPDKTSEAYQVLVEHAEELKELLASDAPTYGAAADLLDELPGLINAVKPAAELSAQLTGSQLTLTIQKAGTAVTLEELGNSTITVSDGAARNPVYLLNGASLTALEMTTNVAPAAGKEYTVTITSEQFQTMTCKVMAAAVQAPQSADDAVVLPETDGLRPVVIAGAAEDTEDSSAEAPDAGEETEVPGVAVLPAPETERAVSISLDGLSAEEISSQEL